jgi:uncharacterized damage-inducible protein DinB
MNSLSDLLRYTEVADNLVIDVLQSSDAPEKALALFCHVLDAQHIWASRILGTEILYTPHQLHRVKSFAEISANNLRMLWNILEDVPGDRSIAYSNFAGEKFISAAGDILFHVVNHSTYHRAQIATELRLNDINPPVTDYIILKRQGLL